MWKIVHGAPAIASDCHFPTTDLQDTMSPRKIDFQPFVPPSRSLRPFAVEQPHKSVLRHGNVIASRVEIRQFSRDTSADG
jgi:hypothetical protein